MTLPATSVFVSAGNVSVAGCPTLRSAASASANPATTTRWCSESIVTKPRGRGRGASASGRRARRRGRDELEELWPATLTVEAPALTVEPTAPLTAVTVPVIGAVSTVAATAFSSAATVACGLLHDGLVLRDRRRRRRVARGDRRLHLSQVQLGGLHRRLLVCDRLLGVGDRLLVLGAGARLRGRGLADTDARPECVLGDQPEDVGRIRLQPGDERAHLALRGARAAVDGSCLRAVAARRPVLEPVAGDELFGFTEPVSVSSSSSRRRPTRSTRSARPPWSS